MSTQTIPELTFGAPPPRRSPTSGARSDVRPQQIPELTFDAPARPMGAKVDLHEQLRSLMQHGRVAGIPFRVTSTTGDKHAANSAHYRGLAIDLVPSGNWDKAIAALQSAGYRVNDERTRKSKEWTGPHLHVEVREFGTPQAVIERRKKSSAISPAHLPLAKRSTFLSGRR